MGRWRAAQPRSQAYITPEGYCALESESEKLWQRRRVVTAAVATAAAEGDRSENAEYIYRKKELREIDRRIRYLQKRMPSLTVVKSVENKDQVFFGAWVTLEDEEGHTIEYRIVGSDELEPKKNYISLDSPLAKALMRKRIDDEIELVLAEKKLMYYLIDIRYQSDH